MKKAIFVFGSLFLLNSCNETNTELIEDQAVAQLTNKSESLYKRSAVSVEVVEFDLALRSLLRPENLPTEDEIRNAKSAELSDRRKDILIPAALNLIESDGYDSKQIAAITGNNRDEILKWALKVYHAKKNNK